MPHEFNGDEYKKASTHQKEWGNKIIAEFTLNSNEHILDLGCGDGALTAELAQLVPDGLVLGIDGSNGMIETARKLETSNLTFKVQDINSLAYENEFDLIFSNATLHWIKDHNRLLKNIFKALKQNGIYRCNFGAKGNCVSFTRITKEAIQLPEYDRYFTGFEWPWYMPEPEAYKSLAKKFAFSEVEVWGENADRYFPDADAITKWIDQPSLVPFLEVVPQKAQQSFRNHVVEKMLAATLQKDGKCFETFRRINVRARK
jgi:trans-aconitate methyltransferase